MIEQRIEQGLKDRILAFEGKAVASLLKRIEELKASDSCHCVDFRTSFEQTKSDRFARVKPISLAEMNRVPKYYGSKFRVAVFFSEHASTDEATEKTVCILNTFAPIVGTNGSEVMWYDYQAYLSLGLTELQKKLSELKL